MVIEPLMNTRESVEHASARAVSRAQRWAGGVIALFPLLTFSGAWVLLIGFRPCVLASLW
jgi:hypothetical protein